MEIRLSSFNLGAGKAERMIREMLSSSRIDRSRRVKRTDEHRRVSTFPSVRSRIFMFQAESMQWTCAQKGNECVCVIITRTHSISKRLSRTAHNVKRKELLSFFFPSSPSLVCPCFSFASVRLSMFSSLIHSIISHAVVLRFLLSLPISDHLHRRHRNKSIHQRLPSSASENGCGPRHHHVLSLRSRENRAGNRSLTIASFRHETAFVLVAYWAARERFGDRWISSGQMCRSMSDASPIELDMENQWREREMQDDSCPFQDSWQTVSFPWLQWDKSRLSLCLPRRSHWNLRSRCLSCAKWQATFYLLARSSSFIRRHQRRTFTWNSSHRIDWISNWFLCNRMTRAFIPACSMMNS